MEGESDKRFFLPFWDVVWMFMTRKRERKTRKKKTWQENKDNMTRKEEEEKKRKHGNKRDNMTRKQE